MNARGAGRGGLRPERAELLSLSERLDRLQVLRVALAGVVLAAPLVVGVPDGGFVAALVLPTVGFLGLSGLVDLLQRRGGGPRIWPIGCALLIDGCYLTWVSYATGGLASPLGFLPLAHLVAVTLLASYRTGLKLAAWYTLLLLVVSYAQGAGVLPIRETLVSAVPGRGSDFGPLATAQIASLWVVAFVTGAFAAASERELRRQKVDLAELVDTAAALESTEDPAEIPGILLGRLVDLFGFARGAVLASPEGDLELLARRGLSAPGGIEPGLDRAMERAWASRSPQLLRTLDAEEGSRLGSLFPGARNVLIVPLFLERERRLGILALEDPRAKGSIPRWTLDVVQQFASHAALALRNAWLLEELRARLEENRALQQELVSKNLELEVRVQERTAELRQSLEDLRRVDEQRRRLLSRLVEAAEAERRQLAGDIHDDPVQKMVAVSMRLQMLRHSLQDPEQLGIVEKLLENVRTSIASLRNLLFELRPSVLDEEGLAPALITYLERLDGETEFRVDNGLREEPPGETRVLLYRIAQEALANVRKHARATRIDVTIAERDGGFLVRINDDGVGFDPAAGSHGAPGHLGLVSMRERAEMAGGWCELHSLPGGGTTVEFWVPGEGEQRAVTAGSATVAARLGER